MEASSSDFLGKCLSICFETQENQENLYRDGGSQDVCLLTSSQEAGKQKMEIHLRFPNACNVTSFIIYVPCFTNFYNYSNVIKDQ
jgi:hypothetical protein